MRKLEKIKSENRNRTSNILIGLKRKDEVRKLFYKKKLFYTRKVPQKDMCFSG